MRTFIAQFKGIKKGALGMRQKFMFPIEAEDEEAARTELYENYERISHLELSEV